MKIIIKSMMSSLVVSSTLFAGGNFKAVTPVEPIIAIPEKSTTYIYVGAAFANIHNGISGDGYSLVAGVPLMQNLAIEGRYASVESGNDHKITNMAIFLKPKMMIADSLCAYGLLGYGQIDYVGVKDEGLEYGAGMAFNFNENVTLFTDYIETKAIEDVKLHGLTTGLIYKF